MRFEKICDCGSYLLMDVSGLDNYDLMCSRCNKSYVGGAEFVIEPTLKMYWFRLRFRFFALLTTLQIKLGFGTNGSE